MRSPTEEECNCVRQVLVAMMVADGDVDPDELKTATAAYLKVTGEPISEDTLREHAQAMLADPKSAEECARTLGRDLDELGKRRVLGAAFAVAAADGFVLEEEDELLTTISNGLGLSAEQHRKAIQILLSGGGITHESL